MILIRRYSWENIRGEEQKETDLNYGEVRLQCWPNDCLGQPEVGPGAKVPFRVDSRWDEGPGLHCNGWEPPRKGCDPWAKWLSSAEAAPRVRDALKAVCWRTKPVIPAGP